VDDNQSDGNDAMQPGVVTRRDETHVMPPSTPADREREARALLRSIVSNTGELGGRMRSMLERASQVWNDTQPDGPHLSGVSRDDEKAARDLMALWTSRDFLVDPDVPQAMTVLGFKQTSVWRLVVRERGEQRQMRDSTAPYMGQENTDPQPYLPVWDYSFPSTPQIDSGERIEQVATNGVIGACVLCNGSGHQHCRTCNGSGFVLCSECHAAAS